MARDGSAPGVSLHSAGTPFALSWRSRASRGSGYSELNPSSRLRRASRSGGLGLAASMSRTALISGSMSSSKLHFVRLWAIWANHA